MPKQYWKTAQYLVLLVAVSACGAAYNDYEIRAQVSEGLNLSGGAKAAVTEYFLDMGEFPQDNPEAGLTDAREIQGKYVSGVSVNAGTITASFGNEAHASIHGKTIVLVPEAGDGFVAWRCSGGQIEAEFLPAACR